MAFQSKKKFIRIYPYDSDLAQNTVSESERVQTFLQDPDPNNLVRVRS